VQNPKPRHFKPFEFFDHTGAKQRRANKASKQQAAQATAQQQQQQEAQAKAAYQQGVDTFKRPFSACMDARGYSIK